MRMKPVSSDKLERWLGAQNVANLSRSMRGFPVPIALAGVPGAVYAAGDGDFYGELRAGEYLTVLDRAEMILRRIRRAMRRAGIKQGSQLNAGFSSLSDMISEATAGSKRREFIYTKTSSSAVLTENCSLWGATGGHPSAGANGAAAPGGTAHVDSDAGGMPFTNPGGGDTQHFVNAHAIGQLGPGQLLLYDRLFSVLKGASSTATQAVTGVPTRYQSVTATDPDYAGGNFCFPEVGTAAIGNTVHNWTVCQYTNQGGTTGQSFPSATGIAAAHAFRVDLSSGMWFMPFAAGDFGVKALTQIQNSASVTQAGGLNFVVGHPIAWLIVPLGSLVCLTDGLQTAFNLARVFDDACLSMIDAAVSTTANQYMGSILTLAG